MEKPGLVNSFKLERVLNQDQNGKRVTLLGQINNDQALLVLERAAFSTNAGVLSNIQTGLSNVKNLGQNDVYHWYMASSGQDNSVETPDFKVNLIYPCTAKHIKKYSPQEVRMVTETPEIYQSQVRPFMQQMRDEGRLNWVFNILEGRAEQEDVLLRDSAEDAQAGSQVGATKFENERGFLLAPDLNWDRKTLSGLHLLALVYRRDFWSLRDLKKQHVPWLKEMKQKVVEATVKLYKELEEDQIKLYVHYQPTYYHFHIHVVHVMCEATSTQAVGKAFGLDNLISQLENMQGGSEASMADVSLTYYLGTASDLWEKVFLPLKEARKP